MRQQLLLALEALVSWDHSQALEAVEALKKRTAALQEEELATVAQMEEPLGESMG